MDQIKKLHQPNILVWLGLTTLDWCIITTCFVVANAIDTLFVYWMCSLVIGNRAHAIAIMGHDAAHYAVSRNKTLNDSIANIFCFWPLGMTMDGYRAFHLQHHRFTGTKDDPELLHKQWVYPQFSPPFRWKRFLIYLASDLMGYGLMWIYLMSKLILPQNKMHLMPVAFMHISFISLCCFTEHYWIPLLWYFSNSTSFWATMRMRIWIEHIGTSATTRVALRWWQRALFAPHWIDLHYEHHAWPSVPCWNLPKLRRLMVDPPILCSMALYKKISDCAAE